MSGVSTSDEKETVERNVAQSSVTNDKILFVIHKKTLAKISQIVVYISFVNE
jgi:hypothetical protein